MGFRFRKSIKAGPFRVNISKSGIGYSAGVKGFRVTKRADGRKQRTYSIPGTGISYVDTSGKRKTTRQTPTTHSPVASAVRTDPRRSRIIFIELRALCVILALLGAVLWLEHPYGWVLSVLAVIGWFAAKKFRQEPEEDDETGHDVSGDQL